MKKIELNKSTCELIEKGVVHIVYKDNVEIELEDVIEMRKISYQLSNGKEYVSVYESGQHTSITKEAREIPLNDIHTKNRKALAIVVSSLAQRLISNFFRNANKSSHPIKIFNSKANALIWAKQFLKD